MLQKVHNSMYIRQEKYSYKKKLKTDWISRQTHNYFVGLKSLTRIVISGKMAQSLQLKR